MRCRQTTVETCRFNDRRAFFPGLALGSFPVVVVTTGPGVAELTHRDDVDRPVQHAVALWVLVGVGAAHPMTPRPKNCIDTSTCPSGRAPSRCCSPTSGWRYTYQDLLANRLGQSPTRRRNLETTFIACGIGRPTQRRYAPRFDEAWMTVFAARTPPKIAARTTAPHINATPMSRTNGNRSVWSNRATRPLCR